jgi:RNA-binding protein YhbY
MTMALRYQLSSIVTTMILMKSITMGFTFHSTRPFMAQKHYDVVQKASRASQKYEHISTTLHLSADSFDQDTEAQPEAEVSLSASTPGIDAAWRHVGKPLLRIGSKGVSATHARSLGELLDAHTCVKVKINTRKLGSLEEAFGCIEKLMEDNSNIELIHVRKSDNMIMVGKEGSLDMIRAGEFPPPPPPVEEEEDE